MEKCRRRGIGDRAGRRVYALAVIAGGFVSSPALAQQADVIRGRVTSDSGQVIEGASIRATSIPSNVSRSTTTDRSGRFTLTFPGGEGDYWINVSAIGFAPRRFELKRVADEAILVADVKLARSGFLLDAVRVQADRARPGRNDGLTDPTGTEKSVGAGSVDPAQSGNLAAMAASLPGVQLIPGADGNPDQFSVFGLGGDQNGSTLNGLSFGGTDLPRDASTRTALNTTPWDVSRGGFSGGQLGVMTQAGSNFSARGLSSLLSAPALQWTDRAGESLGARYGSLSLGGATSGPIALDQSFYSVGYQFDRRTSDLPNLAGADAYALRIAGVSPDSVARLRSILGDAGVPLGAPGVPATRTTDRGLFLAAFDFAPPTSTSGQALNLTAAATFTRANAPFAQVTSYPTNDVRRTSMFGTLQARHTSYFGVGILTESSLGVMRMRTATDPYLTMPNGGVRVASTLDDGSAAIAGLTFGGSATQETTSEATIVAAQNQLSWFSLDNKHRIKLAGSVRYETYGQDLSLNRMGTFRFNSLTDLEAGRAASFTRLLSPRVRSGNQLLASLSLGDAYRPIADLQLQYGIRLDANRFFRTPAVNPELETLFDAGNDVVPNRVYVSPRVGFAWTYGKAAQLAVANGFVRAPRAVVRGGIGLFQNMPNAQLLGTAMSNTGLPGAVQQLVCVGDAVPVPQWTSYLENAASIPTRCADGTSGGDFANRVSEVTLFADAYRAQRSLRSNLSWSGAILGNRFASTVDATYSLNLAQPGFVDLNFAPTPRFALGAEASRPVYVEDGRIVPGTGAIASDASRRVRAYGSVLEQRSDLSSVSRLLSVGLSPVAFSTRYSWSATYVYSNTRDLVRGFSSTAGDPRGREWARSPFDSRHQITYSLSYNFFDWLPVSWTGSFRSGRPFTPMVAGDVNGDGFMNDRAFVFDPQRASGIDQALQRDMRALLQDGSRAARRCLTRQLGALASRNSCQAPWSSTSSLTIALNPVKARLPQRLNLSFYVNNALGAVDLLLNGESRRRGWGQTVEPDQSLLFVRGFDPATRQFRYEVNPRFGATSPAQTLNRNPVVVTAQLRMDIGFTRERQLLTQSLDRGRQRSGTRTTDQELKAMSGALIPPNPMALILTQTDSLRLTRRQADSISTLNRRYALAFDSIWTPVARYLATLPPDYDRGQAYARYRAARAASVDALLAIVPSVRNLLTPDQRRLLPTLVASSLDTRYLASVRSSTAGGANLGIMGMLAQMGWMGGTVDASGTAVMLHR